MLTIELLLPLSFGETHHGLFNYRFPIKDPLCVDVCPTDRIHPKQDEPEFEAATQLFVDPAECIDCGAYIPACSSDSILFAAAVPDGGKQFIETNAAHFKESGTPFHWETTNLVGKFPAHAAEVIRIPDGKWFASRAGWGQGGVYLAELTWEN
jgi:ferredoxin